MPTYRVEAILARSYGTVTIEAKDEFEAKEIATDMQAEDFDRAVDYSLDILDVYEETV